MNIKELHNIFLKSSGVTTDSRQIELNSIFFALKGDNFDGNKYAKSAIDKGASFAVVDNKAYCLNEKYILVDDVLSCLQELSKYHRKQLNCPVLGITGTNGKTTTKELITAVIEKKFKTVATKGNFNNHIGVPLTLLGAKLDTEFLIVEMGANHIHEIEFLCGLAQVDFGIITNIGKAHLEGFGSVEGVIKAKKELYDHIDINDGTLFVNANDKLLMSISENTERILYNTIEQEQSNSPFAEVIFNDSLISSQLIGDYNRTNILAACEIGHYFGVSLENTKEAIESYTPSNNRSQLLKTNRNTIVLDAYNANPSSMTEAIKAFQKVNHKKKLFILGDMLELGENSLVEHQSIIDDLSQNNQEVILIGQEFNKCQHNFAHFFNSKDALDWIEENPIEGMFILLKGSRGIKLEILKEVL
ncbi:MAG: UDP-N-acetylmuramoyl-tripeptide--D-alanyl-D-alanine ligase [Flavobacteriales bacterium]|nr:UDP-N-acetylmuramoyl-tripeptide--D-alanyl-D-alanine ligase [Flavobacteriales bacterium]